MTTATPDPWFGRPVRYARVSSEDGVLSKGANDVPASPYDVGGTMPSAVVVVETALPSGQGRMLWRLGAAGEDGGDSLHDDSAELARQAEEEYGEDLGAWSTFPLEVVGYEDVIGFLREQGCFGGPADS